MSVLKQAGATKLIVDLRDNSGGYLGACIRMVNEFLNKKETIVYTIGRQGREDSYANGRGKLKDMEVTVLINQWSASASEIFAGAMQDNDRGVIIGRRSFGKGLVQQQFSISDSADVRLTIARYYTPAGRCIQKPYKNEDDYQEEILKRFQDGELTDTAKQKHDEKEQKYFTKAGRVVYGGGGIEPDIVVPVDKYNNSYYTQLTNHAINDFAFDYIDRHRQVLEQKKTPEELAAHLNRQNLADELAEYASRVKKIKKNPTMLQECREKLGARIEACIARDLMGNRGYFCVANRSDAIVKKALEKNETQKK